MCDGRRSIPSLKKDLVEVSKNGNGVPEDIEYSLDGILESLEDKKLIDYCG
ncbi:hypothetical protein ACFLRC_01130 [Candidatus Altiarchaeota archaeon]